MRRSRKEQVILFGVTQAHGGDRVAGMTADATTRTSAGDGDVMPARSAYRPGYERIAEQILELIARSDLRPGDRMPTENEIAAQLGTSRTVVREAIKILSALGRIKAQKGRGLYVADDDGMLGMRAGGALPANRPRSRLHALRVPPRPGSRGEPARRHPRHARRSCAPSKRAAEQLCREGHVTGQPDCSTMATTISTSASRRRRTTPSSSRRCARPGACCMQSSHDRAARHARRPRGRSGRGARRDLPGHPRRRAGRGSTPRHRASG